ncbi:mature-T-cell-proliferation protein [Ophiocordyceps camponoti-floridani]|uniref:Cx9C motif-containing protein 4, mitochondrial n=1 Tax=Ophiocordyceps camponoti-floridani TaxID=2030778 RepID=A0A8H4QBN3_9HYPO|nr:mature-T-cell-proliferation protein [Ophiocordyceps camponoti-floridani]
MTKTDDVEATPPCHPRACAIQDCLSRNNYNEAKCREFVRALYKCCRRFYDRYGEEAQTPSCPQPDLLRLKLEQQGSAEQR